MSEVGSCACCKNFRLLKQCTKPGCLSTLCHSKSNSLPCIRKLSMDPFFCPPCTLRLNRALTVKLLYPRFWKMPDKDSVQMHAWCCLHISEENHPSGQWSFMEFYLTLLNRLIPLQPSSQPAESYVCLWLSLTKWLFLLPYLLHLLILHVVCIYQGLTPGRKCVSAKDSHSA